MEVLIVQTNKHLGALWQRHLERLGATVILATSGDAAVNILEVRSFDAIVLDLVLEEGSALTVADVAYFRRPEANVIFVTDTTFFSDGSIFAHAANARAIVEKATPPADLAAIVQHYGEAVSREDAVREVQVAG